jgi:topoisomerase IA-like protein
LIIKIKYNNQKIKKMKKLVSIMAVAALLFSMNVSAQETAKAKKKAAKTEKAACSTAEKKACAADGKKACCAHK